MTYTIITSGLDWTNKQYVESLEDAIRIAKFDEDEPVDCTTVIVHDENMTTHYHNNV